MDAPEFATLARLEREHWFYRGKRDIVRHWVAALAPLDPDDVLIDVGAGTGQLIAELGTSCRAVGVEWHPAALAHGTGRRARLVRGTIERLPIASGRAAVVTAIDVIEHLDDDAAGLAELVRVTRPGGVIVLLVPAFAFLWGEWDVVLGHRRRYTRAALLDLVRQAGLEVLHGAYVNTAAFAPVLVYRLVREHLGIGRSRRLENALPPAALNRLLHRCFVVPATWRWFSPPFGVSVFCLARKPGG
jgi:SAM-dependent methyltransferase